MARPPEAWRFLRLAGLAVGIFAIGLQFAITIPASIEAGRSLAGSVVFFLSFFTILTNIAVVAVYLFANRQGAWFARSRVRAGVAVAITVVSIVYFVLLSGIWAPQGLFLLCDILLHYVAPAIYLAWWLLAGRDGSARLSDVPFWLVYPLAYLGYTVLRGAIVGEVPYPFLDVTASGLTPVIVTTLGVALLFGLLGAIAVAADRLLPPPHAKL